MPDTRHFSEIIEPTITLIHKSGDWNADLEQRRRVIHSFAWISGDKRLCNYGPADAQLFAKTLRDLPVDFRWGTVTEGAMSRPLADVLAEIEAMPSKTPRSDRTFNRDLTIMARFSRELAKTAWRPRYGKDLIVDFNAFTTSIKAVPGETDRMPWTEEQLVCAFSSPIYTGGGGCKRRLKDDPNATVGDRGYLGLAFRRRPDDALRLHQLSTHATAAHVATVAVGDILYHAPEARLLQDVVTAIRERCTVDTLGFRRDRHADRHLKSPEEMERRFVAFPDAIRATAEIAMRCTFDLGQLSYQYPHERVVDGLTAQGALEQLTQAAVERMFPDGVPEAYPIKHVHTMNCHARKKRRARCRAYRQAARK